MEAMKLQGVVSDIPMPTESRKDRIAREKAEQEAAKAQAKANKNQPITKAKASLASSDQTITYTPQKQTPVIIDLPKLAKKFKTFMKKSWAIPAFIIMVGVIVLSLTLLNSANEKKELSLDQARDNQSAESVTISKSPALDTPVASDTPKTDTKAPATSTPTTPTPTAPVVATGNAPSPSNTSVVVPVDTYIIQQDDTLWDIAVTLYGDGTRWTEIAEANKDTLISMDSRNASDLGHWIHVGVTLQLE